MSEKKEKKNGWKMFPTALLQWTPKMCDKIKDTKRSKNLREPS